MNKHDDHYKTLVSKDGTELWEILENTTFFVGNIFKYIMRYDLKGTPVKDLEKAINYINKMKHTNENNDSIIQLCEDKNFLEIVEKQNEFKEDVVCLFKDEYMEWDFLIKKLTEIIKIEIALIRSN